MAALLDGVEPANPHGVMTFARGPRIATDGDERQAGFTFPADPSATARPGTIALGGPPPD